jgi:predicted RNA-binding Zn-ribbon protein involved in translation (DUF1610 family)
MSFQQKEDGMYQVQCPKCGNIRIVKSKKSWMIGRSPFIKECKSCCQVGKEKTEEHRKKLSESTKSLQTEELRQSKSEFMKSHPEIWQENIATGAGGGWNKGMNLPSRDDATKEKISQSMQGKNKGRILPAKSEEVKNKISQSLKNRKKK